MKLYRPAEAAQRLGISASTVRNYSSRFGQYLSPEAKPEPGKPRLFTADDLRLLAFVIQAVRNGSGHAEIEQQLDAGALETFDSWSAPEDAEQDKSDVAVLAPVQQLQLVARLFDQQVEEYRRHEEEARKREAEARQREEGLTQKLLDAQREIGELRGELKALKVQASDEEKRQRPWWQRLFGRPSSEAHDAKD